MHKIRATFLVLMVAAISCNGFTKQDAVLLLKTGAIAVDMALDDRVEKGKMDQVDADAIMLALNNGISLYAAETDEEEAAAKHKLLEDALDLLIKQLNKDETPKVPDLEAPDPQPESAE